MDLENLKKTEWYKDVHINKLKHMNVLYQILRLSKNDN